MAQGAGVNCAPFANSVGTDEHLKSLLIISTSKLDPNCKQLSVESYSYINLINHNYNV
jgi:hypothetical protein